MKTYAARLVPQPHSPGDPRKSAPSLNPAMKRAPGSRPDHEPSQTPPVTNAPACAGGRQDLVKSLTEPSLPVGPARLKIRLTCLQPLHCAHPSVACRPTRLAGTVRPRSAQRHHLVRNGSRGLHGWASGSLVLRKWSTSSWPMRHNELSDRMHSESCRCAHGSARRIARIASVPW